MDFLLQIPDALAALTVHGPAPIELPEHVNLEAPETITVGDISGENGDTTALNDGSADWGFDENTFGNNGSAEWGSSQDGAEFSSRDGDYTSSFGQEGSADWGSSQDGLSSEWTSSNDQTSSTDQFGSSQADLGGSSSAGGEGGNGSSGALGGLGGLVAPLLKGLIGS
ncbi:hypothetical protein [Corynebacterium uterequi]|uniref:Uncharacterized protein n=1 Tax=Corynebacterium uterequi TaxID=1072256 RepID=A0A0G3HCW3_9CORY|nr:hypothetical protein [Corynebacterium uterequi]AKK11201.1 hypothetical protein CUTER_06025 [Corynebacterium uterequi]